MPKLSGFEIEVMKAEEPFSIREDTKSMKSKRDEEVRNKLEDYFEARRMKRELEDYDW